MLITGSRKRTPQAELNVILDLPPLDVFVKCMAAKRALGDLKSLVCGVILSGGDESENSVE